MPRVAQAESRAITRTRLIDAAERMFAEQGFDGASLEAIAESAGYTRGALYYNFSGKDELFFAVLRRRSEAEVVAIAELARDSRGREAFIAALRRRAGQKRRSKDVLRWAQLSDEFWLLALRNPRARRLLAEHNRRLRAAYAEGIQTILDGGGVVPPAPLDHLAAMLLALDRGLPRQSWIDPEAVPEGLFFDVVELLLRAASSLQ